MATIPSQMIAMTVGRGTTQAYPSGGGSRQPIRVVIAGGLYRESVLLPRGGSGTDQMIRLRAATNSQPIISGAEPLKGMWHLPLPEGAANNNGKQVGGALGLSQRAWVVDLDPVHLAEDQANWQSQYQRS